MSPTALEFYILMPLNFMEVLRLKTNFIWHWNMVSNADKKESSQILFGKKLVINKFPWNKKKKVFYLNKYEVGNWLCFELECDSFSCTFWSHRCCLCKERLELYWLRKTDPLHLVCNWIESSGMKYTHPKESSLLWSTDIQKCILFSWLYHRRIS